MNCRRQWFAGLTATTVKLPNKRRRGLDTLERSIAVIEIPAVDTTTDTIREALTSLDLVADATTVEAGWSFYHAAVSTDAWNFDAAIDVEDGSVTDVGDEGYAKRRQSFIEYQERRHEFRNAVRLQLGQGPLFEEPRDRADEEAKEASWDPARTRRTLLSSENFRPPKAEPSAPGRLTVLADLSIARQR